MRVEDRPSFDGVACSINQIKRETRLTNKGMGDAIGVSDASVSNYVNGKILPAIDVLGNVLALLHTSEGLTPEKREELRERFVQAIVPHIKHAAEVEQNLGFNYLEKGVKVKQTFQKRADQFESWRSEARRGKVSRSHLSRPVGVTQDSRLVDEVSRDFASLSDLAKSLGVSRGAVAAWRAGITLMSSENREKVRTLHQDLKKQLT